MFAQLSKLLPGLGGMFRRSKRQDRSQKSKICQRPPERLEERLALSVYGASAAPAGCCCPGCTGEGYVLPGQQQPQAYNATGYKWGQSAPGAPVTVTYSYSNLLGGLGGGLAAGTIKAVIQEALSRWAERAPLNFVEVADSGPAPSAASYDGTGLPMMRFGHRPIDGAWNVLAYGYYPGGSGLAGDIQFDSLENWTTQPGGGVDLLEVATHEIGHTLGLGHQPAGLLAIMNPVYAGHFRGPGTSFLFDDDVNGIRALYGAGGGSVTPLGATLPPPPPPPPPPLPPGLEATLTGPGSVYLNEAAAVSFADTRPGQHFSYDFNNDGAWEVGNGTYAGSPPTTSVQLPASYFTSPRTLVVHGRVLLDDGRHRDTYHTIVVSGRPADVSLPPNGAVLLTDRLLVSGSFGGIQSNSWRVVVDYGDGTGVHSVEHNNRTFSLSHAYADAGRYVVTVFVTGDTNSVGSARMEVTVVPVSAEVLLVRNLFLRVLGRPADAGAEAGFGGALAGGVPVEAVIASVWNSDEARGRRLNDYYRQILFRDVDAGGRASWLDNMRRGMRDEDVIKALVASPEFINANPANADYVRVVFRFVLGRDADPTGLASWTNHLDRGMTREELVRTVLQSGERQANLMDQLFRQYLGRGLSQGDLNAWRPGSNPSLNAESLSMAILQSQEFRNLRYGVSAVQSLSRKASGAA